MARKRKGKGDTGQLDLPPSEILDASLSAEAQRRYLNYALSVITARALPDVRDGLKPVHRRILYTMWNELRLRSDARHRKSAAIVGDVMGKFHPHGDSAIYDALVRMAQGFSMRLPLVDGRGNFGSPDGDAAAAMRYTEARLTKGADGLLEELGKRTVAFRPNYDGTRFEPAVLPASFPNLLVNGSQGIAVGMATSIPPHHLGEVVHACIALIDDPDVDNRALLKHMKGPDFPTGGQLLASASELRAVYESGQGSLKLRGEWKEEEVGRGTPAIVITSIPYGIERRTVVEKIAEVIVGKKLPALADVRDESTDDCRIVCELKKSADAQLVIAYLFKHTPLQSNVQVNLTCLVPTVAYEHGGEELEEDTGEGPRTEMSVCAPKRLDLKSMLRHFLDFRMEVVTRRLRFDLRELRDRIHVLEGFATIFDALDETIRIIRRSDGKQDAAEKLMKRFSLDEIQVDAILELKLYRLAKLQILMIQEELDTKRKEADRLAKLLKSGKGRWGLVRAELHELGAAYSEVRRTRIAARVDEPEFVAEDFIVAEDAYVLLTQQGWVKRQQTLKDVSSTRLREGDQVLAVAAGSTKSSVAFFSSHGSCYVARVVDLPATTGHGSPIQTLFKLGDGERIVAMMGFDPRFLEVPEATEGAEEPEPPYALAVTRGGMALRFSLRGHREPSTRSGRKYCRLKTGDEVIEVGEVGEGDYVACASRDGRALICDASEVSLLSGAGQGVTLIKLAGDDALVGARLLVGESDALVVRKDGGTELSISRRKYEVVSRAGKGHALFKRGKLESAVLVEPKIPEFPSE